MLGHARGLFLVVEGLHVPRNREVLQLLHQCLPGKTLILTTPSFPLMEDKGGCCGDVSCSCVPTINGRTLPCTHDATMALIHHRLQQRWFVEGELRQGHHVLVERYAHGLVAWNHAVMGWPMDHLKTLFRTTKTLNGVTGSSLPAPDAIFWCSPSFPPSLSRLQCSIHEAYQCLRAEEEDLWISADWGDPEAAFGRHLTSLQANVTRTIPRLWPALKPWHRSW